MTAAQPTPVDHKLPDGWRQVRLGDVAEIRKGQSFTSRDLVPGDVPVIAGGMSPAYFHVTSNRPPETVTVSASGAHAGFVAFHKRPIFATDCSTVQNKENEAVINFVFHFLKNAQDAIYYRRRGSAQPHVYPEDIASLHILLPPLPEQRAIAAVLDSIDDAIEGAEAVIAATESLRDALLHDLLTRGLPGQHTKFRDVPGLGTIPADWDVVRLGDVLESTTYGTNSPLSAVGDIPVLRMNNLQNGQINLTDVRRANLNDKETRELNLACGDILFDRTNSLALVGKVAVVRNLPKPMSFASYLVRLRVREDLANPFWLCALLWYDNSQSRIRKFATPGVSQANINPTSLKTLTIPLPTLPEQQATAAALNGVEAAVEVALEEVTRLRLLKQSTSHALLTGHLRTVQRRRTTETQKS